MTLYRIGGEEFEDEENEPEDYEEQLDAALMNCGLVGTTGLCTKAGSEECDWECPFNRNL
jgi:hypothetical protein